MEELFQFTKILESINLISWLLENWYDRGDDYSKFIKKSVNHIR